MDFQLVATPPRFLLLGLLPVVLIAVLVELRAARARRLRVYDWRESLASLGIALGQPLAKVPAQALYAGLFLAAWQVRPWTVPLDTWWGVLLLFVAVEFFYYLYHRAAHEVRWFWVSHAVHHSPEQLNFSAAYRLGWTAGLTGAGLFFLPLPLLGFHPVGVFLALAANLLYQFWLHTTLIGRLGPLEWVLNTPSHHRVHHARNPRYLDANYGGVLIVFDRLFGTFVQERADEPCRYGLVSPVGSYNPLVIVARPWLQLARDLRRARSLHAVFMVLFGPPGWDPDGRHATTAALRGAHAGPCQALPDRANVST